MDRCRLLGGILFTFTSKVSSLCRGDGVSGQILMKIEFHPLSTFDHHSRSIKNPFLQLCKLCLSHGFFPLSVGEVLLALAHQGGQLVIRPIRLAADQQHLKKHSLRLFVQLRREGKQARGWCCRPVVGDNSLSQPAGRFAPFLKALADLLGGE